jgi:peptide/nickel transport system permease protein
MNRILHGDLGVSFLNKKSVLTLLVDVLPYTLELVAAGMLIGLIIGVPPGIIAAVRPNSVYDQVVRFITLIGISLPSFVIGIFLISFFSLKLDLLPAIGGGAADSLKEHFLELILPAFSVGLMKLAAVARLIRASMLEVLAKDFILTARAKGVRESVVILKHAFRNSILPLITFIGIYVKILLGSAVLIEVIFNRPGVGRLIVEAIKSNDFPIVQTVIMFYAAAVVLVNLLIDITYCIVDPRIHYK